MDRVKLIFFYVSVGLSFLNSQGQQIGNYVSNGDFEDCINCTTIPYNAYPRSWTSVDSSTYCFLYCSKNPPISNLPFIVTGYYQQPRSGNNMILLTHFCELGTCLPTNSRNYPRNKLKQKLTSNKSYCVKFYVNIVNVSTLGVYEFAAYFGDESLDTIKYDRVPLTYLNPQVQNGTGNFITDTLNWTLVTGTFVATGNEKYVVLGNFKSNAATNTIALNPSQLPQLATDIYYDDVSCIELNLPAYSGSDQIILPGDSVFIGRQPDFEIDKGCIWFKLPNMTTAIDTVSGLWVKPAVTSTYVVRQELDCSQVKWDTVVVIINNNLAGIDKLKWLTDNISLFPNPTSGNLNIFFSSSVPADISEYCVVDNLGRIIHEKQIDIKNSSFILSTSDLVSGLYQIHFKTQFGTVTKKFVKTN